MAREPRQQIDYLSAPRRRKPTHHAEIDQRDAVAGQIHDVARVWIGMEEAIHEDHLEHGIDTARGERLSVEARIVDGCQVVAADAFDVLLHIHCAARPLPVDAWHEDIEIVGKATREAFRVARFNCEIELALERAAQLADDLDWPVATDFGYLAFDQMGNAIEDSDISVNLCLDSGTPNLQDHWRAAGEFGPVYLRNRGGSVGIALNVGKHFERRTAKRLFNLRQ